MHVHDSTMCEAPPDTEGNKVETPVVTRNDQLTMKAADKEEGRQKRAKKKAHKKSPAKNGKKGRKSRKSKSKQDITKIKPEPTSPSKRKRQILKKHRSKSNHDVDVEEPAPEIAEKQPKRRRKSSKASAVAAQPETAPSAASAEVNVSKKAPRAKAQPKGKAKATPKAKAANGCKAAPKAKSKAAPKAKSKARTKATASSSKAHEAPVASKAPRRGRKKNLEDTHDPSLHSQEQIDTLVEFGHLIGQHDTITNPKFKATLRSNLADLDWTAYNLYWTRATCGIKNKEQSVDLHHFSFSASTASPSFRIAVAAKCGEIAVTRLF